MLVLGSVLVWVVFRYTARIADLEVPELTRHERHMNSRVFWFLTSLAHHCITCGTGGWGNWQSLATKKTSLNCLIKSYQNMTVWGMWLIWSFEYIIFSRKQLCWCLSNIPGMFMSPCNACGCNCTPPMATWCWTPPACPTWKNKPHTCPWPFDRNFRLKFFLCVHSGACPACFLAGFSIRSEFIHLNDSLWDRVLLHSDCCCGTSPQAKSLKSLLGQLRSRQATSCAATNGNISMFRGYTRHQKRPFLRRFFFWCHPWIQG